VSLFLVWDSNFAYRRRNSSATHLASTRKRRAPSINPTRSRDDLPLRSRLPNLTLPSLPLLAVPPYHVSVGPALETAPIKRKAQNRQRPLVNAGLIRLPRADDPTQPFKLYLSNENQLENGVDPLPRSYLRIVRADAITAIPTGAKDPCALTDLKSAFVVNHILINPPNRPMSALIFTRSRIAC
jgi:hypothetical protein